VSGATHTLRAAAWSQFEALGWPSKRHEAWKHADARPLRGFGTDAAPAPDAAVVSAALDAAGPARADTAGRIVLVGGHVIALPEALPEGVRVTSLADAAPELTAHLAAVATADDCALTALNTARHADVLVVHVARGAAIEAPLDLVHVATPAAGAAHPRVLVVAERTAEITLVERWLGLSTSDPSWTNAVTEVVVGASATVRHIRLVEEQDAALHTGAVAARVDRDGHFASHVVSLSGRLGRTEVHAELAAPGASCQLDGLYLAAGSSTLDHYSRIVHAAPHTSSDEVYKGVVDGEATGGFFGRVLIAEGACKSETHQLNHNLLLSRSAAVQTRPQLEIDNDDVVATHGATVGQLDDTAIFYLRARGIDEASARGMLTWAFAEEMVRRLPDADLRPALGRVLTERLAGAASMVALQAITDSVDET
jgi:Fe-S cluster assembly protein SufD